MKALDESFLMLLFTLLLNKVHAFAILCLTVDRETWGSERVKRDDRLIKDKICKTFKGTRPILNMAATN